MVVIKMRGRNLISLPVPLRFMPSKTGMFTLVYLRYSCLEGNLLCPSMVPTTGNGPGELIPACGAVIAVHHHRDGKAIDNRHRNSFSHVNRTCRTRDSSANVLDYGPSRERHSPRRHWLFHRLGLCRQLGTDAPMDGVRLCNRLPPCPSWSSRPHPPNIEGAELSKVPAMPST